MVSTVTRDELKEKIIRGDKFYLVEIESAEHTERGHIPGALRLPLAEIREQASQVLLNKSADLVFFCRDDSCTCAGKAAAEFTSMGYEAIHLYSKGVRDWMNAGLPVELEAT
jgi:rhodanese-related sulfurtransferase